MQVEKSDLIGHVTEVLDKGYVKLIDYMGSDDRVVWSARRSVQDGKKKNRPDEHLIDYLVRNKHLSPLESSSITFEMKLPLFVFAHYVRHRTAKVSSMSLRYSSPEELDFYQPSQERVESSVSIEKFDHEVDMWEDFVIEGEFVTDQAMKVYRGAQEIHGWPSELARIYLPQNMYTNVAITMDLRNLLHMIKERSAKGAQWESQQYANALLYYVEQLFPVTVEAWKEHDRDSFTFSASEMAMLLEYDKVSTMHDMLVLKDSRKGRIFGDKLKAYKEKMGL